MKNGNMPHKIYRRMFAVAAAGFVVFASIGLVASGLRRAEAISAVQERVEPTKAEAPELEQKLESEPEPAPERDEEPPTPSSQLPATAAKPLSEALGGGTAPVIAATAEVGADAQVQVPGAGSGVSPDPTPELLRQLPLAPALRPQVPEEPDPQPPLQPQPEPAPQPQPDQQPDPETDLSPQPDPDPQPEPAPQPMPQPEPAPQPEPEDAAAELRRVVTEYYQGLAERLRQVYGMIEAFDRDWANPDLAVRQRHRSVADRLGMLIQEEQLALQNALAKLVLEHPELNASTYMERGGEVIKMHRLLGMVTTVYTNESPWFPGSGGWDLSCGPFADAPLEHRDEIWKPIEDHMVDGQNVNLTEFLQIYDGFAID